MSAANAEWLCVCGCGRSARTGSRYASDACRARAYDKKNPRVSKAPPELLKAMADDLLTICKPFADECDERRRESGFWPESRPRRPRPPRIHVDVLGKDAELLDRLACEAGISRTAYVSYLIRRAGGRDVE